MTMRIFRIDLSEFCNKFYPAFSRRATQVCILSSAMEKIALGAPGAQDIALAALDEADAFSWKQRRPSDDEIRAVWNRTQDPVATVRAFDCSWPACGCDPEGIDSPPCRAEHATGAAA